MTDSFSADFFAANRQRLRESLVAAGHDLSATPIIMTANGQLQRGGDTAYGFQQDASFWYLTGVAEPDIILVLDEDGEHLFVPGREFVREAFDGAVDHAQLAARSGIADVCELEAGWKGLEARLKAAPRFATAEPNPAYIGHYSMYVNPARAFLVERIKNINPKVELIDIRKDIARLRMVKQPAELKVLQAAIDITIDTVEEAVAAGALAGYKHEYELDAALSYGFRRRGARGNAFDPIVASGKSAATIHSMTNNGPLERGSLVVIDVGAEYQQYCADISRTYSVGGQPTKRQQAVYDAVAEVQDYAYTLIRPGMQLRAYEGQIEAFMGEKLLELKLIKTADKEAVRRYYPHACSHFLGLDPHDAGDYEAELPAGVVLTVEPGIYIPEEGIGVRIEDDVLITPDGPKVLSGRLPRDLV